jgi:hypothetical protein
LVRDAATRGKRFAAGIDPEKIRMNLAAQKANMVEQEKTYFAEIHGVEEKAKRIVEVAGVDTASVAQYVNVARQCYSKAKRFTGPTMRDECQRIVNHWASRGYNAVLLSRVCNISGAGTSGVAPAPEVVSVPREYFEHAHKDNDASFPCFIAFQETATALWKCPSDWRGFARIRWWLRPNTPNPAMSLTVSMSVGTCGEYPQTHFGSADIVRALVDGVLNCVEVLGDLEAVVGLVESCDLVQLEITSNNEILEIVVYGVEIVEATA